MGAAGASQHKRAAKDYHSAWVGCCVHSDIAVTEDPINILGDGWLEGKKWSWSPLTLFLDILREVLLAPGQSFSVNFSGAGGWLLGFQRSEMR